MKFYREAILLMSKNPLNSFVNFFDTFHQSVEYSLQTQKRKPVLCPLVLSLGLGTLGLRVFGKCEWNLLFLRGWDNCSSI